MWGWKETPQRPDNALDLLNDALEDPDYDSGSPEAYEGLWRWPDGRLATPEEVEEAFGPEASIVRSMASEMTEEIDREIKAALK